MNMRQRRSLRKARPATYRRDIQGLRAVAVIAVIANHLVGWPTGGFLGVDVFFVVSGFVITGLLLREHDRWGRISLTDFYRRRIKRIVPAALLVTLTTCAAAVALVSSARADAILGDARAAALFVANWHFAADGTDYSTSENATSPLQHLWSLSVEEQFYVVWPLAIVCLLGLLPKRCPRIRSHLLVVAAAGLIVSTFLSALVATQHSPTAAYFSTPARAWELGVGALIALLSPLWNPLPRVVGAGLAWCGLLGIVVGLVLIDDTFAVPAPWSLTVVVATTLILVGGSPAAPPRVIPLANPATDFVGDISYSLYLWHLPVFVFAGIVLTAPRPIVVVSAALLTLGLATATYYLIERPALSSPLLASGSTHAKAALWREWRRNTRTTYRAGGLSVLAGITIVLCTGSLFVRSTPPPPTAPIASGDSSDSATAAAPTGGPAEQALSKKITSAVAATRWPELTPPIDDVINSSDTSPQVTPCGQKGPIPSSSCQWGDSDAATSIAVVGDSVALAYVKSFIDLTASRADLSVRSIAQFGCPLAEVPIHENSDEAAECSRHRDEALRALTDDPADVIVITDTYAPLTDTTKNAPISGDHWKDALEKNVTTLASTGASIVFLPPPPPGAILEECYTPRSLPSSCLTRVSATWVARADAEKALAESVDGVFVDTRPLFCTSGLCPAFVGDSVVKSDLNHLTPRYASVIAPVLAELLTTAGVLSPS